MTKEAAILLVAIVRIPPEGVAAFRKYEDHVLPLLSEFGGQLERRLRNIDGTLEVHLVSFLSRELFEGYKADPRRTKWAPVLENSMASIKLLQLCEVTPR